MNLATAPDKAQRATRKGAATLHHHVSYELAYGTHHDQQHRERGERALSILEDRFPGIAEEAADITDPPQLSHQAQAELERQTAGGGGPGRRRYRGAEAGGGGRPARTGPRRGPRETRRRASRGGGARTARRTVRAVDTATGGWSTTIGDVFVWAAGLSIFYLLITKAAAAGKLALGASNIARALVSPHVDPLNPKGLA